MPRRTPQFLVKQEPFCSGCLKSLVAVLNPGRLPRRAQPHWLSRNLSVARIHLPGRSLFVSILLHVSVVLFLVRVPRALLSPDQFAQTHRTNATRIYYDLRMLDVLKNMPRVAPPGPGGRPGHGTIPQKPPALGSTAFHSRLTVVSNPPRPDNHRQTIIQPNSPPDLRINAELRLPNVLLGNPMVAPRAPLKYRPNAAKPTVRKREIDTEAPVPSITATAPDLKLISLDPAIAQPRLPVPIASGVAAARPIRNSSAGSVTGTDGSDPAAGDASGLLILSVDPDGGSPLLALPSGNRYGAFSISPAGGQLGSPGGVPGGVPGGGSGGAGAGGDESTGVGRGNIGGGGGGSEGGAGILSINGGGGAAGGYGTLPAAIAPRMVFPVYSPPHVRKNALVVSAGPVGGGGLGVYRALPCGKIYTIFLPMPTKNWILQYCTRDSPTQNHNSPTRTAVVHVDPGILPPDPDEKYDFRRLQVPEDKAHKMIVLKGMIREDGSVGDLHVYQGVLAEMDEAARTAFSRWKFKPAMRAGKAVMVEVLLGIPPAEAGAE